MNVRTALLVALAATVGLALGCTSSEDKQPKSPANAPKLKQQMPAGGGGPKGPAPKPA
jgi:hypothetical protein